MAEDIAHWLESRGFGKHSQAFIDNQIDLDVLADLTEDDFKDLGLPIGDRRRLQAAIEAWSKEESSTGSNSQPTLAEERQAAEAERRQLTVMFCDLAGSTALSSRLDPEVFRALILRYQDACAQVIGTYDGYVARYFGDGVLAYFGYPRAHEDDAARAVHAGLGITDAIVALSQEIGQAHDADLAVRIGIATGPVVVGDIIGKGASQESTALGETPNLAARLQALAAPNTVVISGATQRLVGRLFSCEDKGLQTLKGIPQAVTVYRVLTPIDAPGRFEARTARQLTPLVGRASEVQLLLDRWNLAKDGEGQVVVLSADAGIGKSRILRAFRDLMSDDPHSRILYYGSPYHQNSALYPVRDQIERALRFTKDDDAPQKLTKLETVLDDFGIGVDKYAPALASLLSLTTDGRYPPAELPPEELKNRTLDAILAMVEAMATRTPVAIVVEDLQWIDPSTLEFLDLLVERLRYSRALLLGTTRPNFTHSWAEHAHVTTLTLNRLGRRESAALIETLADGKRLPDSVREEIIAKTDGVPLFIEELTKTVLESDLLQDTGDSFILSGPLPPLAIPASLQDSLMARLDRLSATKDLAQLAAVLGRSFRRDVLAMVSSLTETALDDALSQLVTAGLLYRRGVAPDITYEFKHALVQDAAYGSLLKSTQQQYHRRIGKVLREQFPEIAETQPELLAHHFSQAGQPALAIDYLQSAGETAVGQSANLEAVSHLNTGLGLVRQLPEDGERIERELTLLLILGPALMATKGWAAPEVEATYARACELSRQTDLPSQEFAANWGMWMFNQGRSNHREGRKIATTLLKLSRSSDDKGHLLQAYHANWTTLFFTGELDKAVENIHLGLSVYDAREHGRHALMYAGHDPGVCGKALRALLQWLEGYPDQSLESSGQALALAEELGHPPSVVHAQYFAFRLHTMRGEPEAALALVDKFAETAERLGLVLY